jgi:hypothetical protein
MSQGNRSVAQGNGVGYALEEPRLDRRTALTLPLRPPPQKK